MTHHGKMAAELLQRDLAAQPKLPVLTQHVMRSLSTGADAAAVWREFGEDPGTVNRVVSFVRQSLHAALKEAERPPRTEESADIDSVIKLARDLKRAIQTAMPGNTAKIFAHELHAENSPPAPIALGWHSLDNADHCYGYPLAITDVLDWAIQLAKDHADGLPVRAVVRGTDAKVTAFIRYIAWHFHREFGQEKHGTIARITSSVFNLETPLDGKDVESRLKTRPDVFKPPA